jgi:DNA-binding PadR family transcriptional regulator
MLPATGYAVLGLLSFGRALSGYELKRWADHSLRYFFWSPAQSAIYTELRRLGELGYVRPVGSAEGPRGRQRYRITAAGERALSEWVTSSPTAPTVVKDHALLKVWLGHAADGDALLTIVASERKAAEDLLDEVRYSAGRAAAAQHGYAALVERFCERLAAARLAAIEELAAGLSARDGTDTLD